MKEKYLGRVPFHDNLYVFLSKLISDQAQASPSDPDFRVFRLSRHKEVYAYEETSSHVRIVCKFYWPRLNWDKDRATRAALHEYDSLKMLREYNLVGSPHHIIRPLGFDRGINCALALEYYSGERLTHTIRHAIRHHDDDHLFRRLTALAYFLATLHNRTGNGMPVNFEADCSYFNRLVNTLLERKCIGQWDVDELTWLGDIWRGRSRMWEDQQVWLHGDATPANFLFGHGMDVVAIDLERAMRGDRMFDVGRIAGELQHAFMARTEHKHLAEPFIGHFLWEYSCHFPDRDSTFKSITAKAPYYMGLTLLRIARNDYITSDYGHRLIRQAKRLLRAP
jgi:Phosphotransferase enzyme family